jgi:inorganic pyrophosphatase
MNNLWHRVNFDKGLVGVVEMSNGTTLKTELDKPSGALRLDRMLSMSVPSNYGFIPQTLSDNNKALGVFIFCSSWLPPLSIIPIVPERIVHAMEGDVVDINVIATVRGDHLEWVGAEKRTNHVLHYLENYKKNMKILSVLDHRVAITAIQIAHGNYMDHYGLDAAMIPEVLNGLDIA